MATVNINPYHARGHMDTGDIVFAEFIFLCIPYTNKARLAWITVLTKSEDVIDSELRDLQDIDGLRAQLEAAQVPRVQSYVDAEKDKRYKFFPDDGSVKALYEARALKVQTEMARRKVARDRAQAIVRGESPAA